MKKPRRHLKSGVLTERAAPLDSTGAVTRDAFFILCQRAEAIMTD